MVKPAVNLIKVLNEAPFVFLTFTVKCGSKVNPVNTTTGELIVAKWDFLIKLILSPPQGIPNVLAQYPAQDAALYRAFRGMSRQEAGQALYDSYLPLFPEAALQSRDFRDSMGSDLRNIGQEAKLQEAPWGFKLSEVRCPVVLLHGTADSEVPYSAMEETAKELPHARIIKLEGEEHASPAITDRLMEELLQQDKV